MIIRPATERDLTQLALLRWEWQSGDGESAPTQSRAEFVEECVDFLREGFSSQTWRCWLAECDGTIVSHVFVRRVRKLPRPGRLLDYMGYVTNVYTRPEHRGQGLATKLLEQTIAQARQEDWDVLVVWPSDESVRLYERCGFQSENAVMELDLRAGH